MAALFAYGSLMFPEVWEKVVTGRYEQACGMVKEHARYRVRDMTYPGMIAQPGASVEGVVYFDISDADMAVLDAFEGEAYRRLKVTVELSDGRQIEAQTYLFCEPSELSEQRWEPERFEMRRFLQAYCAEKPRS